VYATALSLRLEYLGQSHAKEDALRREYNAVLSGVITSEARRVQMAGGVGSSNTGASKAEEEYARMQEEKRLQDMYLEAVKGNVEEMEIRNREYQEQVRCIKCKRFLAL
jgi:hypothetical protein